MAAEWLRPDWPAPGNVRACATTRHGGVSRGAYAGLNLGQHVGDDPAAVAENRRRLRAALELPAEPVWLNQVHGITIAEPAQKNPVPFSAADASIARGTGIVCAITTADCLPVLFCDQAGTIAAAAHAGWRGLAAGVLEAAVAAMKVAPGDLFAWLGPAIGPQVYEVGDEVRATFVAAHSEAGRAFVAHGAGKWLCDLYRLARQRLAAVGVTAVYGAGLCTFTDSARFYSFRRDGRTGRMASLIWLA